MLDLSKIPFKQVLYRSSRGGRAISHIIIHQTESENKAGVINWFMNKACNVSAHYLIDKDGSILQTVKDQDKAWHVCNANPFSLGIEHVGVGKMGAKDITPALWEASTSLTAALCVKYNIKTKCILGHRDPWLKQFGNNHGDPSDAWNMDKYRADVQKIIDAHS